MELKIKGAACHLLNFMVGELMKHAFKLAFERGLTDLKGLVEPDSFCETDAQGIGCYDLELELLRTVEDTAIQYLLRSVDTLIETARVYRIINGFDMLETILDDEIFIIATDTYYSMFYFETQANEYEALRTDCCFLYCGLDYLLCGMVLQIELNKLDVLEELEWNECNMEEPERRAALSDKNIRLFESLRIELDGHAYEIDL